MNQIATRPPAAVIEAVIAAGDLAKLSIDERNAYYMTVCESIGVNPVTQPFAYLNLSNKLVLYATKGCTDQLRSINGVSVDSCEVRMEGTLAIATAKVHDKMGRSDIDTGIVDTKGLEGEKKANALMKAMTKAKRRATLSVCGLGVLDESEVDSIPGAVRVETPAPKPAPKQEQQKALPAPEQPKASTTPPQDDAEIIDDDQRAELSALLARKGRSVAQAFAYLKRPTDSADLADLSVGEYRRLMEAMPKIPDAKDAPHRQHA